MRVAAKRGHRGPFTAMISISITVVRIAMSLSTADPEDLGANSVLLERVIDPAVRTAGETFLANLDSITVEQMCETAEKSHVLDDEKVSGDFVR
jgi:Rrf2 family iron-sulfur cluster assembly transcriptional regulator